VLTLRTRSRIGVVPTAVGEALAFNLLMKYADSSFDGVGVAGTIARVAPAGSRGLAGLRHSPRRAGWALERSAAHPGPLHRGEWACNQPRRGK